MHMALEEAAVRADPTAPALSGLDTRSRNFEVLGALQYCEGKSDPICEHLSASMDCEFLMQSASGSFDINSPATLNAINDFSPEKLKFFRSAAANAVSLSFISILLFLGISILAALVLGDVWISKDGNARDRESQPDSIMQDQARSVQRDGRPDMLTGMYFRAALKRTVALERDLGPLGVRLY